MMKKILNITAVLVLISSTAHAADLTTQEDKLSYTLGNQIGSSFRQHNQSLNSDVFTQGLQDGLAGRESKLSESEKQAVLLAYQQQMLKQVQAKMKQQGSTNETAGKKFLAANAKKAGVVVTESGLQYRILKQGSGPKPSAQDVVEVDYSGSLINGKVFDSSYQRGQPAQFPVNQVIPGWTEALQLMPVGSTWQLYIPANLAYGTQGMPMAGIGPNAVLLFKVELKKIIPQN